MTPIHSTELTGAVISLPSAVVAFCLHTLPIVQWCAAVVAIVAGLITIGTWIKHRWFS